MMATRADTRSFVEVCVFLTLLVVVYAAPQEVCDKTKCLGPLHFYEEFGCTPVYKNPGDCCADRYKCSHMKELSRDKCYANGHEYKVGGTLKQEDRNSCEPPCVCVEDFDSGLSVFRCDWDLFLGPPTPPNCYYKKTHDQCLPGLQVCLKEGEERPTCEVDGILYADGEIFHPNSHPEMQCLCMPGYKGENVEPFCKKPNRKNCDHIYGGPRYIHENCAPVFRSDEDPQTKCTSNFRCQNDYDTVIHKHDSTKSPLKTDEDGMCRFGNLTMHTGDELNPTFGTLDFCVNCVCEVPPLVTCRQTSFDVCHLYSFSHMKFEDGDSEEAEV